MSNPLQHLWFSVRPYWVILRIIALLLASLTYLALHQLVRAQSKQYDQVAMAGAVEKPESA